VGVDRGRTVADGHLDTDRRSVVVVTITHDLVSELCSLFTLNLQNPGTY
jgi:hypothetical protein